MAKEAIIHKHSKAMKLLSAESAKDTVKAIIGTAKALAPLSKVSYGQLLKSKSKMVLLTRIAPEMIKFSQSIGPNHEAITESIASTANAVSSLSKLSRADIKKARKNQILINKPSMLGRLFSRNKGLMQDIATGTSGKTNAEKLEDSRNKITIENLSNQIFENNTILKEIKAMLGLSKGTPGKEMPGPVKAKGKGLFSFLLSFLKNLLTSPLLFAGAAFAAFAVLFWKGLSRAGKTLVHAGLTGYKLIGKGIWDGMKLMGRGIKGAYTFIGDKIFTKMAEIGAKEKTGWFTRFAVGIWSRMKTLGSAAGGWFARMGVGIWKFMARMPGIRYLLAAAPESAKLLKTGIVATKLASVAANSQKGRIATRHSVRDAKGRFAPAKQISRANKFVTTMKTTARSGLSGLVKWLGRGLLRLLPWAAFGMQMTLAWVEFDKGNYVRGSILAASAFFALWPGPGTIISLLMDAGLILSDLLPGPTNEKRATARMNWKKYFNLKQQIRLKTGIEPSGLSDATIDQAIKAGMGPGGALRNLEIKAKKAGIVLPTVGERVGEVFKNEETISEGLRRIQEKTSGIMPDAAKTGLIAAPTTINLRQGDSHFITNNTTLPPDQKGQFNNLPFTL